MHFTSIFFRIAFTQYFVNAKIKSIVWLAPTVLELNNKNEREQEPGTGLLFPFIFVSIAGETKVLRKDKNMIVKRHPFKHLTITSGLVCECECAYQNERHKK